MIQKVPKVEVSARSIWHAGILVNIGLIVAYFLQTEEQSITRPHVPQPPRGEHGSYSPVTVMDQWRAHQNIGNDARTSDGADVNSVKGPRIPIRLADMLLYKDSLYAAPLKYGEGIWRWELEEEWVRALGFSEEDQRKIRAQLAHYSKVFASLCEKLGERVGEDDQAVRITIPAQTLQNLRQEIESGLRKVIDDKAGLLTQLLLGDPTKDDLALLLEVETDYGDFLKVSISVDGDRWPRSIDLNRSSPIAQGLFR